MATSAKSDLVSAVRFYIDKIVTDGSIGGKFTFAPLCIHVPFLKKEAVSIVCQYTLISLYKSC